MKNETGSVEPRSKLTVERLREVLAYDPTSGLFTWIVSTGSRIKIGYAAGGDVGGGYIGIGIDKFSYYAHRLAWMHFYGSCPAGDVDHIDGNKSNNSIANLRDVSHSVNLQNQKRAAKSNKSSGLLGVSFDKSRSLWSAKLKLNGATHNIGLFDTAEKAHAAYIEAKRRLHPGGTL